MESEPAKTFRGLPLTAEQDSEIKHYIHRKQRCGSAWQTPELNAMLTDMLDPPEQEEDERQALARMMHGERAAAAQDDAREQDKPDN